MDFPHGPVVRILSLHCREHDLIPGQATKIPQAAQPKKKIPNTLMLNVSNKLWNTK